eukprot:COSAG02_NODE_973_length_15536_cov_5.108635_5_plen_283_part_00
MSNTFSVVIEQAEEEWRLIFAGMVREYFDSNVLPPPLNLLEVPINRCMRAKMAKRRTLYHADGHKVPRWGQHYLFPVPSLRWHLPMAMASYLATSKDQGERGIKHIIGKLDKLTPAMSPADSYSMSSSADGASGSDTSSSHLDNRSPHLDAHKTLTALTHDFATEVQPLRHDLEGTIASVGSLTKKVASMDEKLSAMFDMVKNNALGSDLGDGGLIAGEGIKRESVPMQSPLGLPEERANDALAVEDLDSNIDFKEQEVATTNGELVGGGGDTDGAKERMTL